MRTDDDLMAAVRAGDQAAFETLFERYREPIWRFFRRRLTDAELAADLSQEVFVAVLRGSQRYEPRSSFRSYLFGIAFNQLAAARRQRSSTSTTEAWQLQSRTTPDPDDALWVRQALAGLDDGEREILMLREYDGMTYDDIAALTGVPLGTVRSRLFRAREALRQKLAGHAVGQTAQGVTT